MRAAREALDKNQRELCRMLNVQPNAWNQYETGYRPPNIDVMMRFADRMGVSLDWIYRERLDAVAPVLANAIAERFEQLIADEGEERDAG